MGVLDINMYDLVESKERRRGRTMGQVSRDENALSKEMIMSKLSLLSWFLMDKPSR